MVSASGGWWILTLRNEIARRTGSLRKAGRPALACRPCRGRLSWGEKRSSRSTDSARRQRRWLCRLHPRKSPGCCSVGLRERSEEHTSELQSRLHLVCRLLLEKKKKQYINRNVQQD